MAQIKHPETMELSLDGRAVAFLAHYMAKNDIRYYLNGIYVAPMPDGAGPGVIAAATNGHLLGIWRDTGGTATRPAIMRVSKALARACKPNTRLVTRDRRLAVIDQREAELYIDPSSHPGSSEREPWEVHGSFPIFDKVVPEISQAKIGITAAMSADYLGLISESLSAVVRGRRRFGNHRSLQMRQGSPEGAILALSDEVPEAVMVMMPLRVNEVTPTQWFDRWLTQVRADRAKAKLPTPGRQPSDAVPPPGGHP